MSVGTETLAKSRLGAQNQKHSVASKVYTQLDYVEDFGEVLDEREQRAVQETHEGAKAGDTRWAEAIKRWLGVERPRDDGAACEASRCISEWPWYVPEVTKVVQGSQADLKMADNDAAESECKARKIRPTCLCKSFMGNGAGNGIVSCGDVNKGECVGIYGGEVVDNDTAKQTLMPLGRDGHLITMKTGDDKAVDANTWFCTLKTLLANAWHGGLFNSKGFRLYKFPGATRLGEPDARNRAVPQKPANVEYTKRKWEGAEMAGDTHGFCVALMAKCDVREGDELVTEYKQTNNKCKTHAVVEEALRVKVMDEQRRRTAPDVSAPSPPRPTQPVKRPCTHTVRPRHALSCHALVSPKSCSCAANEMRVWRDIVCDHARWKHLLLCVRSRNHVLPASEKHAHG